MEQTTPESMEQTTPGRYNLNEFFQKLMFTNCFHKLAKLVCKIIALRNILTCNKFRNTNDLCLYKLVIKKQKSVGIKIFVTNYISWCISKDMLF